MLAEIRGAAVASTGAVTRREEGSLFGLCFAPPDDDDEGLLAFFLDGPFSSFFTDLFAAFFTVSSLSLAAWQVSLCPPLQCCFWQALEQ